MITIDEGNLGITKLLLEKENKLDLNAKDDSGLTALHEAVIMDDMNVVKSLVEKGANLEIKDFEGQTVLMNAIEYRNDRIFNRTWSKC